MKKLLTHHLYLTAVATAILIGYAIGSISIYFFEEYGWQN